MSPRPEDREKLDILGAAEEEHAEPEEARATPEVALDEDEEESAVAAPQRQQAPVEGYTDLYLDTINRNVLDFDFEKLCSVALPISTFMPASSAANTTKAGSKSQAYFHALEEGHHVYVNMETKKVYVLPEGYEVKSKSLDDIKFVVDPRLTRNEVARLDKEQKTAWDLSGRKYIPGFVGMNKYQGKRLLQRHHPCPRTRRPPPQLLHAGRYLQPPTTRPTV